MDREAAAIQIRFSMGAAPLNTPRKYADRDQENVGRSLPVRILAARKLYKEIAWIFF
jgi:hypothetical protein